MNKIKTIFDRNWEGDKAVVNKYVDKFAETAIKNGIATEKIDGMNVRATIRNGICVRLEKRRNPDKIQKYKGIEEPWYVDASEFDKGNQWLFDALKNTELKGLPDGEWSGEAVGPNIQGNPLNLPTNRVVFFTLGQAPTFEDVPTDYEGLKAWLPIQKSKYGTDCGIEGIVWHCLGDGEMYKIKTKDFKPDNRS